MQSCQVDIVASCRWRDSHKGCKRTFFSLTLEQHCSSIGTGKLDRFRLCGHPVHTFLGGSPIEWTCIGLWCNSVPSSWKRRLLLQQKKNKTRRISLFSHEISILFTCKWFKTRSTFNHMDWLLISVWHFQSSGLLMFNTTKEASSGIISTCMLYLGQQSQIYNNHNLSCFFILEGSEILRNIMSFFPENYPTTEQNLKYIFALQ